MTRSFSVKLSSDGSELVLDYSKNIVTEETVKLLVDLVCLNDVINELHIQWNCI